MTKCDYVKLAAWLHGLKTRGILDPQLIAYLATSLSNVVGEGNPRFDADRFINAACDTGLPVKEDK